ncbi:tetratricopeptide repeat protein [candidate division KSB1 bacterium]|nr:tetratricopeptide repeat protein [candidate division KSB1 bacterium]
MKKITILFLFAITIIVACNKSENTKTVFHKAEKLEGEILKSINSIAECKTKYEKVIRKAPESEFAPIALYKLGKLNEIFGHYEEAVEYYKKLASIYPEHQVSGEGLFNMAQIYQLHLDKPEKAILTYNQLIGLYPENKSVFQANVEVAQIYCQKEKWESAVKAFQRILDKYPEEKIVDDISFRIADIYSFKLKENSTAAEKYLELINNYPNSSWVKLAEGRLAQLKEGEKKNEK